MGFLKHPSLASLSQAYLSIGRHTQTRLVGFVLLGLFLFLQSLELSAANQLRFFVYDLYQKIAPREANHRPALIVDIDEASLEAHGQWPWPRTEIAKLIDKIAAQKPAAIGLDMFFSEPDRSSPDRILKTYPNIPEALAKTLEALPSNDKILAQSLRQNKAILAVTGLSSGPTRPLKRTPVLLQGGDPKSFLLDFPVALRSLDLLMMASAGQGVISVPSEEDNVMRRMPMVVSLQNGLHPSLAAELFRVALSAPVFTTIMAEGTGLEAVKIGNYRIPTAADGRIWVHFSPHQPNRFVSATEILQGTVAPDLLSQRFILVGSSALGLGDYHATPQGPAMQGTEIQVQLLENIFGYLSHGEPLLTRPHHAPWMEWGMTFGVGLLLILTVPLLHPRYGAVVLLGLLGALIAGCWVFYLEERLLLDYSFTSLASILLFTAMVTSTALILEQTKRGLEKDLAVQKEAALKVEGELTAARNIQMSMLPDAKEVCAGHHEFTFHATLEPARAVGGDLYDVFMIDDRSLFVMIGDVTDKGVPASLFMSLTKALLRSIVLRRQGDLAAIMTEANDEISRDNKESMFVTVFAGILDLQTGQLDYCIAGHEPPFIFVPGEKVRLLDSESAGGPPLCAVPGFPFSTDSYQLTPGESFLTVTDGVTEALDLEKNMYGDDRLEQCLDGLSAGTNCQEAAERVYEDVKKFVGTADQSDDITILTLTYLGPN